MGKMLRFEANLITDSIEKVNKEFSIAKCRVMYTGENRNGSFISKDTVESALDTIYNIPVVAEIVYKEGEKDFGTHGGKIIIDSGGVKYEQTTVPYGVVPESCNPRWENVNGSEYLVCDIILWTGRYEDMSILTSDEFKSRPQSMEIKISNSGKEDDNYEHIYSFSFSALTILGLDVEPCFEEANVQVYKQDGFKQLFDEMFDAYTKFYQKGGLDIVDENIKEFDNVEEEILTEPTVEEEIVEFALTYKQRYSMLAKALPEDTDYEGEDYYEYSYSSIIDFTDETLMYSTYKYNSKDGSDKKYFQTTYKIEGEVCTVDFESQSELFLELITKAEKDAIMAERDSYKAQFEEASEKLETYQSENESLKEELETEKAFRLKVEEQERKDEIDAVVNEFSTQLSGDEEFEKIVESRYEMTKEDIEDKCYILVGKKSFKANLKKVKKEKEYNLLNVEESSQTKEVEKTLSDRMVEAYTKRNK